jgi:hypothetical protein
MKVLGIAVVCAVSVMLGLGRFAQAAPLDLKYVSGGAKWLVHLDADAARAATISQHVNEKVIEGRAEIKSFVAKVHELTGMDFRTDLYDVTMYGKQVGTGNPVVVARAKIDAVDLILRVTKAKDYKVIEYGLHDIHTWAINAARNTTRPTAIAVIKSDTLVMATTPEDVQAALDVLDGKTGNAAGGPLSGDVRRGTILSLRSAALGEARISGMLQTLKDAESISLSLGEADERVFIDAKAVMADADSADAMTTMLEGAKLLGQSRFADDEKTLAVVDALKIGGEGKTVTVRLDAKADDIWQVIEARAKAMPGIKRPNRPAEKP